MSATLWHNGPIEEYQVRDCSSGESRAFRDFDEADAYANKRRQDYPQHAITLIAVIDS